MDVQTFRADTRQAIEAAHRRLDEFLELPPDASFEQVVQAFDGITWPLNGVRGRVSLMSAVHPDKAIRDAAEELEQEIVRFYTELSLSRPAFDRLSALDPARAPDAESKRFLEHALRDFRRSGVDKDEATRERVRALQQELVEIGQTFDRNIVEDVRRITFEDGAAVLEGLPEDYVRAHPLDEEGRVVITTDPPDYIPFMTFSESGEARRELYHQYLDRAWPANGEQLERMLARRHELAQLLGYASWADYVTEDKMVRTAAEARAFLERVVELARPRMEREVAELLEEKRAVTGEGDVIYEYERGYWIERVKRKRHAFDSQSVRPYFPYERVLEGVLDTSSRLYGVEFRPNASVVLWHPSVRCFDVVDDGAVVARLFLDMHPREGKFKHAACFDIQTGVVGGVLPEGCLVCNFPEPKDGDPALLLHDQVTTLFHEFGHLLHHLFASRQRFLAFGGIATEWDFVEVPSQMYEEWAWDHGVLQRFARHHETGEPIPEELVERMRAADEYGKGIGVMQQMLYALLSLTYYDRDPATLDTTQVIRDLKAELLPFPHEEGTHLQANFGHLHGYSAIYYTYMWSLVIAKDLFSRFGDDLLDRETAARYRETVLAPGGSKDAAELVRDFLGRDYEFAAYERWLNRG